MYCSTAVNPAIDMMQYTPSVCNNLQPQKQQLFESILSIKNREHQFASASVTPPTDSIQPAVTRSSLTEKNTRRCLTQRCNLGCKKLVVLLQACVIRVAL